MFYPIWKIEVYIVRTRIDRWNERKNRWNLKFREGLKGEMVKRRKKKAMNIWSRFESYIVLINRLNFPKLGIYSKESWCKMKWKFCEHRIFFHRCGLNNVASLSLPSLTNSKDAKEKKKTNLWTQKINW